MKNCTFFCILKRLQLKGAKDKLTYNRNFEGIARKLEKAVSTRADDETDDNSKNAYTKYFNYQTCGQCGGTRLNERATSVKINGLTIADLCRLELVDVASISYGHPR